MEVILILAGVGLFGLCAYTLGYIKGGMTVLRKF